MTATASQPIHRRGAVWNQMTQGRHIGRIGGDEHGVSRSMFGRRWRSGFMDVIGLLAIALGFPLVVLLVGTPIALTIALLLWFGRVALGAF